MAKRSSKIKSRIDAIIARDSGMPYPDALSVHNLSPNQFYIAVSRDLDDLILTARRDAADHLRRIASSPQRIEDLFDMGEEFVREQYTAVREGSQRFFVQGTHRNRRNVERLVYFALSSDVPALGSRKREKVVSEINKLPEQLHRYFKSIGLAGLMVNAFGTDKQDSPIAVLEAFDAEYQKKTGDKSLFDLGQPVHLHKWGDNFRAPQSYWKVTANVEEAVYHTLLENMHLAQSAPREEVIENIGKLPKRLAEHFHSIGLCGLMTEAFSGEKKGSPLAVLEVFDTVYQRTTKDKSLFDLSQPVHIHKWGDNFRAPQSYWKVTANVEESVWHTFMEKLPLLPTDSRAKVVDTIKGLPTNRQEYLHSLGLTSLMMNAFYEGKKDSPLAVLEVFDKVYQRQTGDASLFDLSQPLHLHRWGDGVHAPREYWQNQAHVEEAVYHTLTEDRPDLKSDDRRQVILAIKRLPECLQDYMISIDLTGLLLQAFDSERRGSPRAVLEVFDTVYQRATGNKSLFDKNEEHHLEFDGRNQLIR